jgi:hypothetical protein
LPRSSDALRKPVPGRLFAVVKIASYLELALFTALLVVWIAPGYESATSVLGLSHGLGFVALCILIWIAVLRREAPYPLLAATLTPAGPVGSVLGIALIERRGWGVAPPPDQTRGD